MLLGKRLSLVSSLFLAFLLSHSPFVVTDHSQDALWKVAKGQNHRTLSLDQNDKLTSCSPNLLRMKSAFLSHETLAWLLHGLPCWPVDHDSQEQTELRLDCLSFLFASSHLHSVTFSPLPNQAFLQEGIKLHQVAISPHD